MLINDIDSGSYQKSLFPEFVKIQGLAHSLYPITLALSPFAESTVRMGRG